MVRSFLKLSFLLAFLSVSSATLCDGKRRDCIHYKHIHTKSKTLSLYIFSPYFTPKSLPSPSPHLLSLCVGVSSWLFLLEAHFAGRVFAAGMVVVNYGLNLWWRSPADVSLNLCRQNAKHSYTHFQDITAESEDTLMNEKRIDSTNLRIYFYK